MDCSRSASMRSTMTSRGVPSLFGPIWAAATFTWRGMVTLLSSDLHDLLVHAGGNHAIHTDGLGHVLEGALAEALEDEVGADALGGGRPHHDLAAFRRAREARGHVGDGPGGGERPALARRRAQLRGPHERLAGVDAHVQRHRGKHAAVL